MTLLQSALVFWLLASRGAAVAFSGALGMSALTFVQFLNPTAHWYALFICTLAVALLSAGWHRRRGGLELLGFVLVTLFLFRQLSGVFAAMGRSEEHTSELQSLMRISYAVFCLKKKKKQKHIHAHNTTKTTNQQHK